MPRATESAWGPTALDRDVGVDEMDSVELPEGEDSPSIKLESTVGLVIPDGMEL